MAYFGAQLHALHVKNTLIRSRNWGSLLVELGCPILMCVLLGILNASGKKTNIGPHLYPRIMPKYAPTNLTYTPDCPAAASFLEETGDLAFVSLEKLRQKDADIDEDKLTTVKFFFDDCNVVPKNLKYQVVVNQQYDTEEIYGPSTDYSKTFELAHLAVVNGFTAFWLRQQSLPTPKIVAMDFQKIPKLPFVESNRASILQLLRGFFGFFFFGLVCYTTKGVVEDKETKIKESMKLMGLSGVVYWLSWLLIGLQIGTIISVVFLLCTYPHYGEGRFLGTNPILVFAVLILYVINNSTFAMAMSCFIQKARNAVTVAATIFIAAWFGSRLMLKYCVTRSITLVMGTFVPQAGINVFVYELFGLELRNRPLTLSNIGVNFTTPHQTCLDGILMMVTNTVFNVLFLWYMDNVNPGDFGLAKPYYFCITKDYWCPVAESADDITDLPKQDDNLFEQPPRDMKPGVMVRGLVKMFGSHMAVAGTSMDLYQDQISVLLGHNGAGKTTTISMITGFLKPTAGSVIVNGYDIAKNLAQARSGLGLCPQHDILFNKLTCKEHLVFFLRLRGQYKTAAREDIEMMLTRVGLKEKMSAYSVNLSGGQRRKLSVACSFIGGNKTVFLDEPSSGLDPSARRELWDFLKGMREGRTILLTTHYMYEADVLGDRIMIMAKGVVKCGGTPMFLKQIYGTGYKMHVVKKDRCNSSQLMLFVQKHIPDAKNRGETPNEIFYLLPDENAKALPGLFAELEQNMEMLKVSSFGVTATSMEDVFIRVGEGGEVKPITAPIDENNMAPTHVGSSLYPPPVGSNLASTSIGTNLDTTPVGSNVALTPVGNNLSTTRVSSNLVTTNIGSNLAPPPISSNLAPTPISSNLAPTPIGINLATTPVGTSIAPTPVCSNLAPTHVSINLSPTPGGSIWAPTLVGSNLSPTPDDCNLATTNVGSNMFPTPVGSNLSTIPSDSNLASSPVGSNLATTPVGVNLTITPVSSNLAPTPVGSNLAPTAVGSNLAPTPFGRNLATTPVDSHLATSPVDSHLATSPVDSEFKQKFKRRLSIYSERRARDKEKFDEMNRYDKNKGITLFLQQTRAILSKRRILFGRSLASALMLLVLPVCFTMLGIKFDMMTDANKLSPPMFFTLERFKDMVVPFFHNSSSDKHLVNVYAAQFSSSPGVSFVDSDKISEGEVVEFLLKYGESEGEEKYEDKVIVGAVIEETKLTFLYQGTAIHAKGISMQLLSSAYVKSALGDDYSIQLGVIHQMPKHYKRMYSLQIGTMFCLGFAMALVPVIYINGLIAERAIGAKHLQALSGVSPLAYWLGVYTFDMLLFIIIIAMIMCGFTISPDLYLERGRWAVTLLILMSFAVAMFPYLYAIQIIFKNPANGVISILCFNVFVGVMTAFVLTVYRMKEEANRFVEVIHWFIAVISPNYVLTTTLITYVLAATQYYKEVVPLRSYLEYEGKTDKLSTTLSLFIIHFVGGWVCIAITEFRLDRLFWYNFFKDEGIPTVNNVGHSEKGLMVEDDDVLAERIRINETPIDELCDDNDIVIKNLRKKFRVRCKPFVAVQNTSLALPQNECLGLLGQNGAGKTTTFKMLTGDHMVSSGDAYVKGLSIKKKIKVIQTMMGYCPQFDALHERLTGRETLYLYARLRGVPEKKLREVTDAIIEFVTLNPHEEKMTFTYSGGNKRKLSVGIAIIGDPLFVMLDEPTAGMDPVARRTLWTVLQMIRSSGRTMVLTSHSMEECEALCTRIAIMVKGTILCLGSPQHLKNKYGQGYTVVMRANIDEHGKALPLHEAQAFMVQSFPKTQVFAKQEAYVHLQVPDTVPLSALFTQLEHAKQKYNLQFYSVQQTTLEQVFLMFMKDT